MLPKRVVELIIHDNEDQKSRNDGYIEALHILGHDPNIRKREASPEMELPAMITKEVRHDGGEEVFKSYKGFEAVERLMVDLELQNARTNNLIVFRDREPEMIGLYLGAFCSDAKADAAASRSSHHKDQEGIFYYNKVSGKFRQMCNWRTMEESPMTQIINERIRQVKEEGFTPEHDDQWVNGELAIAAACYAAPPFALDVSSIWPWARKWDKRYKKTDRERLVTAAALIIAEIERIDRQGEK